MDLIATPILGSCGFPFLTVQLTHCLRKFTRHGPFRTLRAATPAANGGRGGATPVLAHTCLNVFKINFYL